MVQFCRKPDAPGGTLRHRQEKVVTTQLYGITDAITMSDAMDTRSTKSDRCVAIDLTTLRGRLREAPASAQGDSLVPAIIGHHRHWSRRVVYVWWVQQVRGERAVPRARAKARKADARL